VGEGGGGWGAVLGSTEEGPSKRGREEWVGTSKSQRERQSMMIKNAIQTWHFLSPQNLSSEFYALCVSYYEPRQVKV
jgi:hypothetical protein